MRIYRKFSRRPRGGEANNDDPNRVEQRDLLSTGNLRLLSTLEQRATAETITQTALQPGDGALDGITNNSMSSENPSIPGSSASNTV